MGKLFLDIETTEIIKGELPSTIFCVVTICDKGNIVHYTEDNLHQLQIDASNYSEFIGHNIIGFDAPVLKKVLGLDLFKLGKVTDTLVLSRLFNPVREGGHSLKAFGLKFGYHNHDYEFESDQEQVLYDVLLENTDPSLVYMELDLGWVVMAGKNPVDYFRQYPGRFPLWHLKDMSLLKGGSTEFGKGDLNISQMLENTELSGVKYMFMEQEEYDNNPFDSARYNLNYLAKLAY